MKGSPLTAARFKQSRAIFVIRKIVTAAVTLLFFALISLLLCRNRIEGQDPLAVY